MDKITLIFLSGFFLILIIYFFFISPFFRKATFMTVKIPSKAVNKAYRKSRKEKKEVALVLDYEANSKNPQHIRMSKGNNNSVFAFTTRDDEILLHTHPKTNTRNPIAAKYENTLRERPSEADLSILQRSKRRTDLLITPSGRTIQYSKIRQNANSRGLNKVDYELQKKHSSRITNTKEASASAKRVNKAWINEAEQRGFKIREVRTRNKDLRLKTEVR